jgi:hypothetical protein
MKFLSKSTTCSDDDGYVEDGYGGDDGEDVDETVKRQQAASDKH